MSNYEQLRNALQDLHRSGELPESFCFRDILAIAKRILSAKSGGQDYASIQAVQKCCACAEPRFHEFQQWQGDPRTFPLVAEVRDHWIFHFVEDHTPTAHRRVREERPRSVEQDVMPNPSNTKACELVAEVFEQIRRAATDKALEDIVNNNPLLKQNKMSEKTYPPIRFFVSLSEIEDLQRTGVLDREGRLTSALNGESMSALEKLLFAIVWKNGDLGKERHIVKGIQLANGVPTGGIQDRGLVFSQFGKYLSDRNHPIIDQHVMRSFSLYKKCGDAASDEISKIRRKSSFVKEDKVMISAYEEWLESDELQLSLRQLSGYKFYIDKVLFALGRHLKLGRRERRSGAGVPAAT